MGLGDLMEVENALGVKREPPVQKPKPTVESMLSGILEAAVLTAGTGEREPKTVTLSIERDTRNGYVQVIDRTTGIGGDQKRTLVAAVESLYQALTAKAAGEERKAREMLTRLGVKPEEDGPQG